MASSQASDAEMTIDEIVVNSTQNFGGLGVVVFQIRSMIKDDEVLLQEIRDAQIEVVQNLHEKMMDVAGERRSPVSKASLDVAVDAFTTAVLASNCIVRRRAKIGSLSPLAHAEVQSRY